MKRRAKQRPENVSQDLRDLIRRDLEGLAQLHAWQQTLAANLRRHFEALDVLQSKRLPYEPPA